MLNKVLGLIAFLIIVFVVAGSAVAIFRKGATPGEGLETLRVEEKNPSKGKFGKEAEYNLLGKLWIPLKKSSEGKKATLIVSPWLEYNGDREFYEEMDSKNAQILDVVTSYFSAFSYKEMQEKGENAIKSELISKINAILVLGNINQIWFNDYQILEE